MNKIQLSNLTLTNSQLVKPGSIILWDSNKKILDSSINLYAIYNDLLYKENEIFRIESLINTAITEISLAKALNDENTVKFNKCQSDLSYLSNKILDINTKVVSRIETIDSYFNILNVKESELHSAYSNIFKYAEAISSLKINSYLVSSSSSDSNTFVSSAESELLNYEKKMTELESNIKNLNQNLFNLNSKITTLNSRLTPTTYSIMNLREYAAKINYSLKNTLSDILKVEDSISKNLNSLCSLDNTINIFEETRSAISSRIENTKSIIANYENKVLQLLCDINILYEKSVNLNELSTRISDYLNKTMDYIKNGLLVAGDNIEIEYINGFAKIHSRLPEYPPRIPPKRECFESTPVDLTYPAPPCPPIIPPCPTCCCPESITVPSPVPVPYPAPSPVPVPYPVPSPAPSPTPSPTPSPPTVTNTTSSITSSTTPEPGCYFAYRMWYATKGSTSGSAFNFAATNLDCITGNKSDCGQTYYAGRSFTNLADAQAWVESNEQHSGCYPMKNYMIVKYDAPCGTSIFSKVRGDGNTLSKAKKNPVCIESGQTNQITSSGATRNIINPPNCP